MNLGRRITQIGVEMEGLRSVEWVEVVLYLLESLGGSFELFCANSQAWPFSGGQSGLAARYDLSAQRGLAHVRAQLVQRSGGARLALVGRPTGRGRLATA